MMEEYYERIENYEWKEQNFITYEDGLLFVNIGFEDDLVSTRK